MQNGKALATTSYICFNILLRWTEPKLPRKTRKDVLNENFTQQHEKISWRTSLQ